MHSFEFIKWRTKNLHYRHIWRHDLVFNQINNLMIGFLFVDFNSIGDCLSLWLASVKILTWFLGQLRGEDLLFQWPSSRWLWGRLRPSGGAPSCSGGAILLGNVSNLGRHAPRTLIGSPMPSAINQNSPLSTTDHSHSILFKDWINFEEIAFSFESCNSSSLADELLLWSCFRAFLNDSSLVWKSNSCWSLIPTSSCKSFLTRVSLILSCRLNTGIINVSNDIVSNQAYFFDDLLPLLFYLILHFSVEALELKFTQNHK